MSEANLENHEPRSKFHLCNAEKNKSSRFTLHSIIIYYLLKLCFGVMVPYSCFSASINNSISPWSTSSTLAVSAWVRWSLTIL